MQERTYSAALVGAVSGGMKLDVALKNLKKILERNGHSALYANILKEAEAAFAKAEEKRGLEVTLANADDHQRYKKDIERMEEQYGKGHATVRIDETITGGYIARTDETEVDASFKTALRRLYRSLTT